MEYSEEILIENFFLGKLTKNEYSEFKQKMDSDKKFKQKVSLEKEYFNIFNKEKWNHIEDNKNSEIKEYEQLFRNDKSQEIKRTINKAQNKYNKSSKTNYIKIISIAASIIIIINFFLFQDFSEPNSDELYSFYLKTENIPTLTKRNKTNSLINNAEQYFLNKEFSKANKLFLELVKESQYSSNSSILIYITICQIELNETSKAHKTINSLINSNLIDSNKGYWYKSLILLQSNSIEECKTVLKTIINNKYYNYKKAEELLLKLN